MRTERFSVEARDAVVDGLLRDAAVRIMAVGENGLFVPMPASFERRGDWALPKVASLLEMVASQDIVKVIEMWEEARRVGAASTLVHAVHAEDVEIALHAVDMTHRYGVYLCVLVGYRDATEDEAASTEDVLRPRVCVVRKNELAVITALDETATRLLGWRSEDAVGRRSLELTHPDDQQRAIANWLDLLASPGSARRTRLRQQHSDGSWHWFEITNRNLLNHPDHKCVLAEMVDIDDEMAADEALRRGEQLMRRLTEALPVGILQLDLDGVTTYRNERLASVVGRPVASAADVLAVLLDPLPMRHALDAVAREGADTDLEVEVSGDDGFRSRLHVNVRALMSDAGAVTGSILCLADVTEAADLREQLAHKATHDALTGCLSRGATLERLHAELAGLPGAAGSVSVLFIDLDGFKDVNDRHGHAAGDAMLREVGRRLLADAGAGGVVGRFGGDEFVVIVAGLESLSAARTLAAEVSDKLLVPFEADGVLLVPHASVGAAWTSTDVGQDALVARADASMYELKRARPDPRVPLRENA